MKNLNNFQLQTKLFLPVESPVPLAPRPGRPIKDLRDTRLSSWPCQWMHARTDSNSRGRKKTPSLSTVETYFRVCDNARVKGASVHSLEGSETFLFSPLCITVDQVKYGGIFMGLLTFARIFPFTIMDGARHFFFTLHNWCTKTRGLRGINQAAAIV